jgi:hypothetical protein
MRFKVLLAITVYIVHPWLLYRAVEEYTASICGVAYFHPEGGGNNFSRNVSQKTTVSLNSCV